ncbi:hypothetical protein KM043_006376 [Ampulex compressa]|nr:hypothetical protein KM043_006376 [Ampulex compressa]
MQRGKVKVTHPKTYVLKRRRTFRFSISQKVAKIPPSVHLDVQQRRKPRQERTDARNRWNIFDVPQRGLSRGRRYPALEAHYRCRTCPAAYRDSCPEDYSRKFVTGRRKNPGRSTVENANIQDPPGLPPPPPPPPLSPDGDKILRERQIPWAFAVAERAGPKTGVEGAGGLPEGGVRRAAERPATGPRPRPTCLPEFAHSRVFNHFARGQWRGIGLGDFPKCVHRVRAGRPLCTALPSRTPEKSSTPLPTCAD